MIHHDSTTVPKTNQQSVPKHLSSTSVQVFYLVLSQPQMSIISSVLYSTPNCVMSISMFSSVSLPSLSLRIQPKGFTQTHLLWDKLTTRFNIKPQCSPLVPTPNICIVSSVICSHVFLALARGLLGLKASLIKYTFSRFAPSLRTIGLKASYIYCETSSLYAPSLRSVAYSF